MMRQKCDKDALPAHCTKRNETGFLASGWLLPVGFSSTEGVAKPDLKYDSSPFQSCSIVVWSNSSALCSQQLHQWSDLCWDQQMRWMVCQDWTRWKCVSTVGKWESPVQEILLWIQKEWADGLLWGPVRISCMWHHKTKAKRYIRPFLWQDQGDWVLLLVILLG